MELNLIASNCTSFRISTECKLKEKVLEQIKECSSLPEDIMEKRGIAFGEQYVANSKTHSVLAVLVRKKERNNYFLEFLYAPNNNLKSKKEIKPISSLINCLKALKGDCSFACLASFSYSLSNHSSLIPLPIKAQSQLFSEIRGFRLWKKNTGDISYDIIIEKVKNKDIFHNISFECKGDLSRSFIEDIFTKASELSKRYVTVKKTGGSDVNI